jgi:Papain-like cysteine protease AvrRpt2
MLILNCKCSYSGDKAVFVRYPSLKQIRLQLKIPTITYQSDGSAGLNWVHNDPQPITATHLLGADSHRFELPTEVITSHNHALYLKYFADRMWGNFLPHFDNLDTPNNVVQDQLRQMTFRGLVEYIAAQNSQFSQITAFNLLPLLVTGDVVNKDDDAEIATLKEYFGLQGRVQHADKKVLNHLLLINADVLQECFQLGNAQYILFVLLNGLNGKGQLLAKQDLQRRFKVLTTDDGDDTGLFNAEKFSPSYDIVEEHLADLLAIPLNFANISALDVAGKLSIKTEKSLLPANFSSYALSLTFQSEVATSIPNPNNPQSFAKTIETSVIDYDWQLNPASIKNNSVDFAFGQDPILTQNIISPITVRLQGFDGATMWQKDFDKDDQALANLKIAVPLYVPAALGKQTAVQNDRGYKLRGQVVDATAGKASVKNLTVMVQVKYLASDTKWVTVGATSTDGMGNFSMIYPQGVFFAAQAVVSSAHGSPAAIFVKTDAESVKKQKTLDEGFIYLVLQSNDDANTGAGANAAANEEDCDCNVVKKVGRLPNQEDLIASDEYTQDMGTGCINLSTPNRTLSEHAYVAIVRTSDPDVANYELKREEVNDGSQKTVIKFSLSNGNKVKRATVDLFNPIRWQDDPSDADSLSFYQSVTVAHGHVLRYKSVWKADGYSLGDLLYSLPLAPGQKKQIVINDLSRSLQGGEQQQLSQSEYLAANLLNERSIVDSLAGSVSENVRGNSTASTGGISVTGGASYAGMANLGVSGGYSKSDSDASQDSGRNIAQNFEEKLRHSTLQNAQSYRQSNAAVVGTVSENQKFSTQVEVVANHNHCHSMTMMYFEVLRHYAVYQELSAVEECIFIPLLMTTFTRENIYKWRDPLAANLLYRPSSTYLPSAIGENALVKGFDANQRIQTNYANVDYPEFSFADDPIQQFRGELWLNVNFIRPISHYDRIKSWPIVEQRRNDAESMFIALFFGLFAAALHGIGNDKKVDKVNAQIDKYMTLDSDYENKPPAQAIRIKFFDESFFDNDAAAKEAWNGYAELLERPSGIALLREYFKDRPIAQWDEIFYTEIAPKLARRLGDKLQLSLHADFTLLSTYYGGEQSLMYAIEGRRTSLTRRNVTSIDITIDAKRVMKAGTPMRIERMNLYYTTAHYGGVLYSGSMQDDLDAKDAVSRPTPVTADEERNPRKEDRYLVAELLEHLNSNLEHYNKVLWYNLDPDRRYMLLDGFHIQVYDDFNQPSVYKSLASVVRNEMIGVAGNSLIFPVAPGFKLDRSYIISVKKQGDEETVEQVSLSEHYKPLTPVPPYRISVPTRGVFCEAVNGSCFACEKVVENTSQDWEKFKTDEPTTVNPVTTGTPTVTEWKPTYKDFAQPIINIQNAPTEPAPGVGLGALSQLLGQSGIFKDITGLDQNQKNAIETFKSTQESAKAMAELAAKGATQKYNTDNSDKIMKSLDAARNSGAIDAKKYGELVQKHIEHQIDGGKGEEQRLATERERVAGALTQSVVDAVKGKQKIKLAADAKGNITSLEMGETKVKGGEGAADGELGTPVETPPLLQILAEVKPMIMPLAQETGNVCWAAVATMMYSWKQGENLAPKQVLAVLGQNYIDGYDLDMKLTATQKPALLQALGMKSESALTNFPLSTYIELMNNYGPLWVTIDANTADGPFSPHAIILTKISGESASKDASVTFTLIDPDKGQIKTIAFLDYVKHYEQMITDNKKFDPYIQIAHFKEKATPPVVKKVYTTNPAKNKNTATNSNANPPITAKDTITIRKLEEANIVFYKGHFQVDADGAPNAYHPKNIDAALDYLGNAGHDAGKVQKKVYNKTTKKWEGAIDPDTKEPIMKEISRDWYGVVTDTGKRSGKPIVNSATGYHVSPTSLKYDDVTDRTDPAMYVNSAEIPYIAPSSVVYHGFPMWYGDFGLIYDTVTKKQTFAIVADGAPAHGRGEGSIKAYDNLGLYPEGHAKNAKGVGIGSSRFLYVIFAHTVPGKDGHTKRLSNAEIQAKGAELLAKHGGQDLIDQLLKMV